MSDVKKVYNLGDDKRKINRHSLWEHLQVYSTLHMM
jgi:hypothetical protein